MTTFPDSSRFVGRAGRNPRDDRRQRISPADRSLVPARGNAKLEPDDDYAFARKLGAKYGGADLREQDNPGESRLVVTIEPANVYAVDMSGG